MEPQRPELSSLCHLAMLINIQLDASKSLAFEEIYGGLDDGDLFARLERLLPGFDVFGLLGGAQAEAMVVALREVAEPDRGNERRKLGIEHNGLLSTLTFSAIQERLWVDSPPREPGKHGFPLGN